MGLSINLDSCEIAVLIGEALLGEPRPEGMAPGAILKGLPPHVAKGLLLAATAVIDHIADQLRGQEGVEVSRIHYGEGSLEQH